MRAYPHCYCLGFCAFGLTSSWENVQCLQKIELEGIPFLALPALLLSTSDLVTLRLLSIPHTGYISPEDMVAALAILTRLEDLRIGLQSPASGPDRIRLPPITRIVLPSLTYIKFWGLESIWRASSRGSTP
jgi:hypothetical protein